MPCSFPSPANRKQFENRQNETKTPWDVVWIGDAKLFTANARTAQPQPKQRSHRMEQQTERSRYHRVYSVRFPILIEP